MAKKTKGDKMRGNCDTTGVKENSGFEILPPGEYLFDIFEVGEAQTKNFDPMAKLILIVHIGEHANKRVFDNIIIPKEGSQAWKIMGRTKHFLHCIGEPYEGQFEYDTARWVHKTVRAEIKHEIQKEGKYAGKPRAIVSNYILDELAAIGDPFSD